MLDIYPPAVRVRVTALRTAMLTAAGILAPLMVTLLIGGFHLTWRGALIVLAVPSVLVTLVALRLRDPGFGRWDSDRVRELVHREASPDSAVMISADPPLGYFEATRRIWLVPSLRKVMIATIVSSMVGAPVATYYVFWLQSRWGLDAAQRGLLGSATAALGAALALVFGPVGDRLFGREPRAVITWVVRAQFLTIAASVLSYLSPWFVLMAVLAGVAQALPLAITPVLSTTVMNVVPSRLRPAFVAMLGVAATLVGGTFGVFFLAGLDQRIGLTWSLVLMNIPFAIGLLVIRGMRDDVGRDLDATVQAVIEQEELAGLARRGVRPPLLACRKIDFWYGPVQVLFDVDLSVDDGEMVALLGTNGAGKSTLLGVVSGLNLPSAGSVRLQGADITYVDPERRVGLGLSQISGGKATFPALSVVENLRAYGYSLGRSRRAIERGIEQSFVAFPRLAERRNQLAQTLSGGEQQMLGLSQALILRPRLLCIDELSLGLAPKIVAELLDMVRQINASGTAVILVEQSASIALSLVEHAYFMERGQIRFDGSAGELLHRDDLLRSVFLQGADHAIAMRKVNPS
jgi:ABC-type branched-subunit amino acid transport system ATPase component